MGVEFFSLARRDAALAGDIRVAIDSVLESSKFVGGPHVNDFEDAFAAFLGASHAVGVGNGLDALRLSLLALDVGPGDEVIVPGFTFVATWLAVLQVGAKVVAVDVEMDTANVSVAAIESAITPRTKCAVIVHLYGRAAMSARDVDRLRDRGIAVVEDAAQAHGCSIHGSACGTLGDIAAFSFYPTKNLGALGDAGAVVTSDAELAQRVRELRSYGFSGSNRDSTRLGWNSRLDPIQAAVLRVFLRHLPSWNEARRGLAEIYIKQLQQLGLLDRIVGAHKSTAESVWHIFAIRVPNRDLLFAEAETRGIELAVHYAQSPSEMEAFRGSNFVARRHGLPNSLELARSVVSLPLYPQMDPGVTSEVTDLLAQVVAIDR